MGSDYEDSDSHDDESKLNEEMEEEGEYEEEEDEEEEEEESEIERVGEDGQITEEKIIKRRRAKKNKTPEPHFKFDPVRFLAKVLKSIEETGKVPEREVFNKPNVDVPKVDPKKMVK